MTLPNKKTIGGFFGLEPVSNSIANLYHDQALALTSGRSCFNLIINSLKPVKIYLPFYTCDSLLIPLQQNSIAYEFYALDQDLMPCKRIHLNKNEFIVYINYFGLMNFNIDRIYENYGNKLILDNTQAFFEKQYKDCWSFNSARKFFGVADGGYLYSPQPLNLRLTENKHIRTDHLTARAENSELAYPLFQKNEETISAQIAAISTFSNRILASLDYAFISQQRINNFKLYSDIFNSANKLKVTTSGIPFCYPLLINTTLNRKTLSNLGLYIPSFWQDVINRTGNDFEFEKSLSTQLLPLPLDHRYQDTDCRRVIDIILSLTSEIFV